MITARFAVVFALAAIASSAAAQAPSPMHPQVPRLDAHGRELRPGEPGASAQATCGRCHDADYIARHSSHGRIFAGGGPASGAAPDCFDCHTGEAAAIRAGAAPLQGVHDPSNENCLACHGAAMTERTGAHFSAERIGASGLNVRGKAGLTRAFDVHAERLVRCVDCHHAANNPAHAAQGASAPAHLARDPRRAQLAAYLERPDHRLAQGPGAGDCTACHDPSTGHEWLPDRGRHLAALACQSCHVPELYGPALRLVDWTLPDAAGAPRREYRNLVASAGGVPYVEAYEPTLLPTDASPSRLAPVNPVMHWRWRSGEGEPVSPETVRAALLPNGALHPRLIAALDADADGMLAPAERSLSTQRAVATAAELLAALGVSAPRIAAAVVAEPVSHGVARGERAIRECSTCHRRDAIAFAAITLPGAIPPGQSAGDVALPAGMVATSLASGALHLAPEPGARGAYLLGRTHIGWVNTIGLLAIAAVVLGALTHALLRLLHRHRQAPRPLVERVPMYSGYERLWHWVQALAVIGLLLSGLAVHRPDLLPWLPFPAAVRVHNALGVLLLLNAALAAFYHVATGALRRYLPQPRGFLADAVAQLVFYTRGMFRGEPHPFHRTPERRLNPLQQVTYLMILNVLLPVQILSGLLIWIGEGLGASVLGGSLGLLAAVHTLAAWFFTAFLLMHIYLTTTGRTPLSNIRAMVDGWEEVEPRPVHTLTAAQDDAPVRGVI